jgi:hypothetical protein
MPAASASMDRKRLGIARVVLLEPITFSCLAIGGVAVSRSLALIGATAAFGVVAAQSVAWAQDTAGINAEALQGRPYSPYADRAFPTEVYFGDTHSHTSLSADAGGGGTRLGPRDAYRFARGEQVTSNTGQPVKLSRPLDFYMITDHSDGMGAINDLIAGTPEILADPTGKKFHEAFAKGGQDAANAAFELTAMFSQGKVPEAINYQPGHPAYKRVWNDIIQAAEEYNEPNQFTTFIAFEWTSLVNGNNLHRNVIIKRAKSLATGVPNVSMVPPPPPDGRLS